LKNKSKYRNGKGIDIRKDNGYIVCEPSKIDDKKYKFIRHFNHFPILNIPSSLLTWLLEFETINKKQNDVKLIIKIDQLKPLLKLFDNNNEWFKVTTCMKNLIHEYNEFELVEVMEVWDEWSKGCKKYNKVNNKRIWDTLTSKLNFNYLINSYNAKHNDKINLLESIKSFEPITRDINHIDKFEMNNKYIYDEKCTEKQLTKEVFNDYDTIIIKSTTGTGKTSNTAKFIHNYIVEASDKDIVEKYKVLSIVSRISLSSQHIMSFKNENIVLNSYLEHNKNIEDDNLVICLNSILLFSKYKSDFFKNYIVYIDEITTFTRHLTHNQTLNNNLKLIYVTLIKIILNCKKLILSEAIINDNVFNLIEKRKGKNVFIENIFKKYEGVQAVQYNDENKFLSFIISEVEKKKFFLFGCDSCDICTKYYTECLKYSENCILITAETKFKFEDVNEQFKDKFVFYSPSITCGVDFNINENQNVFIYIKGDTIEPCDSFQQLTRTRNINKAYFYIKPVEPKQPKYETINDCVDEYKEIALTHSRLCTLCSTIDENDDVKFNDNTFFKLFVYNEYLNDVYNTNKERHFKKILSDNGFIINSVYSKMKLNKTNTNILIENRNELKNKIFVEHVEDVKYNENLDDVLKFLNIKDKDTQKKYNELISDKFLLEDYLNLIRYCTKIERIKEKVARINKNNVEYKAIYTINNKILLIHELENELKIKKFDISKLTIDKPFKISDDLLKKISIAFRCEIKPETYNECIEYYVNKLKNIFGKINVLQGVKKQINKIRSVHYSINKDVIKFYFELHFYSDPYRENTDEYVLSKFKDEIKIREDEIFIDNDDEDEEENKSKKEENNNKSYWTCRFCNIRDFEFSCNFFNDMQCNNCMKKPMLKYLNTLFI
jgi:hypothetical protein